MTYIYKDQSGVFSFFAVMLLFSTGFRYLDHRYVVHPDTYYELGVPGIFGWVVLLILTIPVLLITFEEYRFTASGVIVAHLFIQKHYVWDDFAFCGMLPKGVLIDGKPNQDERICFSIEEPLPGKKLPSKCYYLDYSPELNEILRMLVPERFGKTLKESDVSTPADMGASLEDVCNKLKLFDVIAAVPVCISVCACMLISSSDVLFVTLVISMGGAIFLKKYFDPQTKQLEKVYQYLMIENLRHQKENAD